MPEQLLSESLESWADHTAWEDDEDEEAWRSMAEEARRLEAENARLLATMHEAEENWLESIQRLEAENANLASLLRGAHESIDAFIAQEERLRVAITTAHDSLRALALVWVHRPELHEITDRLQEVLGGA